MVHKVAKNKIGSNARILLSFMAHETLNWDETEPPSTLEHNDFTMLINFSECQA